MGRKQQMPMSFKTTDLHCRPRGTPEALSSKPSAQGLRSWARLLPSCKNACKGETLGLTFSLGWEDSGRRVTAIHLGDFGLVSLVDCGSEVHGLRADATE